MDKIVECVPNFSEGKDKSIINAISAAVESVDGVKLLDADPNKQELKYEYDGQEFLINILSSGEREVVNIVFDFILSFTVQYHFRSLTLSGANKLCRL